VKQTDGIFISIFMRDREREREGEERRERMSGEEREGGARDK